MKLTGFRIVNFRCFKDSGWHTLAPHRNIIVGENNSGKTALLVALSRAFENRSNRSGAQPEGAEPDPDSTVTVRFALPGSEIDALVLRSRSTGLIPMPASPPPLSEAIDAWWEKVKSDPELSFEVRRRGGGAIQMTRRPSFDLFDLGPDDPLRGPRLQPNARAHRVDFENGYFTANEDVGVLLAQMHLGQSYMFGAQRVASDESGVGVQTELTPDASNLPSVLQVLSGNTDKFEEFGRLVREVLPGLKIGIRPAADNRAQIWVSRYASNRDDLYQRLRECGTGVGQVLSLLYVVHNSTFGRTIIIDEPNSFLHPGAVRRLFGVLKQYEIHQFIVSTHSPEVIASCEPEQILMTHLTDDHTEIVDIDVAQIAQMKVVLTQVGARLSDVFGADSIVWVEGATEERCVPMIAKHVFGRIPPGLTFLGLTQTGDVLGKKRAMALRIYKKLSTSSVLIPPAVAIILDREALSEQEMIDLRKESSDLLTFHARRCFENYLLDFAAVTHVLNGEDSSKPKIVPADVDAWLQSNGSTTTYFKPLAVPHHDAPEWRRDVNGAAMLADIFKMREVEYDKPTHGVALTEFLLAHEPKAFDDWKTLLQPFVDKT